MQGVDSEDREDEDRFSFFFNSEMIVLRTKVVILSVDTSSSLFRRTDEFPSQKSRSSQPVLPNQMVGAPGILAMSSSN